MKYLVCFDGSTEAQNAVEYAKSHANKETDEIVLFGECETICLVVSNWCPFRHVSATARSSLAEFR
jgi:hypothetical protein